jgi:hypothetical protein
MFHHGTESSKCPRTVKKPEATENTGDLRRPLLWAAKQRRHAGVSAEMAVPNHIDLPLKRCHAFDADAEN